MPRRDWSSAESDFVLALESRGIFQTATPTAGLKASGYHGPVMATVFCDDYDERRLSAAIRSLVDALLGKLHQAGANACFGFSMDVDPWAERGGVIGVRFTASGTAASLQHAA